MAKYAVLQFTVTDEFGNVVPGADVDIRAHTAGNPLIVLYPTRTGGTPVTNPTVSDADGEVKVYAVGGAYQVTASKVIDGVPWSRTWTHKAVGTAAEYDANDLLFAYAISFVASSTMGDGEQMPVHNVPLAMYLPATLPNARARFETAPLAGLVVQITQNGSNIGTITFTAGVKTGVFALAADTQLAEADRVGLTMPNPRDNLAADFSCTLLARR